jgi:hypothetical protein
MWRYRLRSLLQPSDATVQNEILQTLPDFVGGSKDELEALKARQIIARGEASEASVTPGHLAKLIRALKRAKDFLSPFQGLDQSLTLPGVALASLASPLAIVYRAFSAPEEAPTKSNRIRNTQSDRCRLL